jgi:rhamnosyltransferase subunit B
VSFAVTNELALGDPRHVVLSTIGSAGDVHPFVAIGRELRRRGHRVTLVTNAYFEPLAAQAGLDFVPLGAADDYLNAIEDPELWDSRNGFRVLARRVLVPAIRPLYRILSGLLDPSTILVSQGQAFGAHLAHEKHGVPFVTIQLQPAAFRSSHDAPLFPAWLPQFARRAVYVALDRLVLDRELAGDVNAVRAELGLPAVRRLFASWVHSPQKTIGLFPEWFAAPQPDWPPRTELTGFVFLPEDPAPLDPRLSAFLSQGAAPVVFTPGTAARHANRFFEGSIQASLWLGHRALLITRYQDQLPSRLPEGIAAFRHVPFPAVLPHCAALVHHGGIGTAAQALAAGIPQLVRPAAFDQPDNAARLQRLGVASSIRPADYKPVAIVERLHRLLSSPDVAANCRRFAARIDPGDAVTRVCEVIEAVG